MILTEKEYTKHFIDTDKRSFVGDYIENQRVTTKLGAGMAHSLVDPLQATLSPIKGDISHISHDLLYNLLSYKCTRDVKIDITPEFKNIYELVNQDDDEQELYFYHGDHLGSSSWITDASGSVNQYLAYTSTMLSTGLPFGEQFIDQRQTGHDIRFKFMGKERDAETGMDYFGVRYYSSDLSVWLSVDPLASKYPGISPYAYVFNNPINFIDLWGLEGEKPNPPKDAKQGDKYSYKNNGGGSSNYKYEEGVGWVGDGYSGDIGGVTITGKRPSWISKQAKAIKSWWKKSTNYMKVEGNVTWGAQLGAKVQVAGASVSIYGNMSSQTVLSLSANQTGTNESPWNFDAEYLGDDDYKTMTGGGSISCIGGYEFEEKYQLAWKGDDYGKMNTMTTSHTVNVLITSYTHTNNSSGAVVRDGKVAVGVKVAALIGLEIKVTFGTK